jgi:SH3-like domain-containing protein
MRASSCRSVCSIALGALICALTVSHAAPARADDHDVVFAINGTELHKRPGEAAPVVGHADEGDELEVLGDSGRWLRVRNGKQIGWVTRTEVATTKPASPRPHAPRSGFAGTPVGDTIRVTIEADRVRGYDDPRTKAKAVLDLVRGDVVPVLARGYDGWLLVEPKDGTPGWIPESVVKDWGKFAGDPRLAPAEVAKAQAASKAQAAAKTPKAAPAAEVAKPAPPIELQTQAPRITGMLLAAAGGQTFKMRQHGSGAGTAIATGALADLDAGVRMRLRRNLWIGLDTSTQLGTAGLTYYASAQTSPSMSTQELAIDASAELGMGRMPYVAARAGIHYATFSVESDRQEPMLIGERIAGATVGLGGALPLGRRLVLSATVDVMPVGSQQMSELPAGTLYATSVRAAWAQGTLAMPLPAHLLAALSYRFGAQSADLTDNAAMPRTATRTDLSHVVTAGVGVAW